MNVVCKVILSVFAVYNFLIELSAAYQDWHYWKTPSRLFNFLVPISMGMNLYFSSDLMSDRFWTLNTWAALFIWARMLLYLRNTTDTYGWMVRVLTETVIDIFPFLIIYFIGVFAFADAFESIEQLLVIQRRVEPVSHMPYQEDGENFYVKYFSTYVRAIQTSFLTSLGEHNPNLDKYREIDWLVFFISVFMNIIILMNLLIAIISETYTRISLKQDQTSY